MHALLMVFALSADSEPVERFGSEGTAAITGSFQASVGGTLNFKTPAYSSFEATLAPNMLFFPVEDLAIGFGLLGTISSAAGIWAAAAGFRMGYNFGHGSVSFVPTLGMSLGAVGALRPPVTGFVFGFALDLPILFHLAPHYFVGITLSAALQAYNQLTGAAVSPSIGFVVGGWR